TADVAAAQPAVPWPAAERAAAARPAARARVPHEETPAPRPVLACATARSSASESLPPSTDPAGAAANAPTRAPAGAPRKAGSEPTWPHSCARGCAGIDPVPAGPVARHRRPD